MKKNTRYFISVFLLFILASCAPEVKFKITKPAELPINNVKVVTIGTFSDQLKQAIPFPQELKKSGTYIKQNQFKANQQSSDLVRALTISALSKAGQYKIINSTGTASHFSGSIPNASTVGILNAKIRYYEQNIESFDETSFILLATNNNVPIEQKLLVLTAKNTALATAQRSGKGFKVKVPFVEKVAAMEIQFDFIRKSDGSQIIPTQTFRTYFTKKWGGKARTSIIDPHLKKTIQMYYPTTKTHVDTIFEKINQGSLLLDDYEEYMAKGYFLKRNPNVPLLSIDLREKLAQQLVKKFIRKISRYEEETHLEIASGDSVGVNLMKGNAYEEAINYYENMPKPLDRDDLYNMALAYESIGEFYQALKYYQQGVDQSPGDAGFQKGLKRVKF